MKRKHSYAAVHVEQFDLSALLHLVPVGCIVAVDVALQREERDDRLA